MHIIRQAMLFQHLLATGWRLATGDLLDDLSLRFRLGRFVTRQGQSNCTRLKYRFTGCVQGLREVEGEGSFLSSRSRHRRLSFLIAYNISSDEMGLSCLGRLGLKKGTNVISKPPFAVASNARDQPTSSWGFCQSSRTCRYFHLPSCCFQYDERMWNRLPMP